MILKTFIIAFSSGSNYVRVPMSQFKNIMWLHNCLWLNEPIDAQAVLWLRTPFSLSTFPLTLCVRLSGSTFYLTWYIPDLSARWVMGVISEQVLYRDNQIPRGAERVCGVSGLMLFPAQTMFPSWSRDRAGLIHTAHWLVCLRIAPMRQRQVLSLK